MNAAEEFWARVTEGPDGCWLWAAGMTNGGYGRFYQDRDRGPVRAHRWAYEYMVGEIPEGLQIDHLCRVRLCVNPYHLEPVPQRVNILRGDALSAVCARRTHCAAGHEYTPENTRTYRGGRRCRQCHRDRERAARRWRSLARAAS